MHTCQVVLPPETQEWYTELEPAPTARSFMRRSAMGVAAALVLVVVAVAGNVQQPGSSAGSSAPGQRLTALASSHAHRQLPQV